MKWLLSTTFLFAALTGSIMAQQNPAATTAQQPANGGADVQLRTMTPLGCFETPGEMWDMGSYMFQSIGWCQAFCVRQSVGYFALVNGTNCFCGNDPPPATDRVASRNCSTTCNGIDEQYCGGDNYWQAYDSGFRQGDNTGTIHITTPSQTFSMPERTSTSRLNAPAQAPTTTVVTVSNAPESTVSGASAENNSGPNVAGIVAGVVVGVVLFAAIVGGVFFYMRRRKMKELEDERRRHEAMTSFVTRGEKPPSTYSSSDSRLEPSVMFQRRQSDGSIADNQDYSRRILKVTNPDDR